MERKEAEGAVVTAYSILSLFEGLEPVSQHRVFFPVQNYTAVLLCLLKLPNHMNWILDTSVLFHAVSGRGNI